MKNINHTYYRLCVLLGLITILLLIVNSKILSQSKIYLSKSSWHVDLILRVDSITINRLPILMKYNSYNYVMIGWGDEDFYQDPEFNILYGVKALLYPTNSVVRIIGTNSHPEEMAKYSEMIFELNFTSENYDGLLNFINKSFLLTNNNYIMTSESDGGDIAFYKSNKKYSLIYTCNSWIAEVLYNGGCVFDYEMVLTSEQLFESILPWVNVVKAD